MGVCSLLGEIKLSYCVKGMSRNMVDNKEKNALAWTLFKRLEKKALKKRKCTHVRTKRIPDANFLSLFLSIFLSFIFFFFSSSSENEDRFSIVGGFKFFPLAWKKRHPLLPPLREVPLGGLLPSLPYPPWWWCRKRTVWFDGFIEDYRW